MNKTPDKFVVLMVYALLGLVTLVAYARVFGNEFVDYDDNAYVTENQHVIDGINLRSVSYAFGIDKSNWHPLTWISHMLDCELFGLDPAFHHLTNLLIHIANTLLLLWVLHFSTKRFWPSAFVAAVFALHPLHVESVAWVAERKDVLSAFFWLLTIAAYVKHARRPGLTRYVLVIVLFALGLMSKPMVVTLPLVLLLLDYWPLDRLTRHTIFEKIPMLVISFASCIVTYIAQKSGGAVMDFEKISLNVRMGNVFVGYMVYIEKIFLPFKLAVLYPLDRFGRPIWQVVISLLILLLITYVVVYLAKRKLNLRFLIVGWLWFLGTLVPVIGLIQVGKQSIADRYTYIPAIGIFIMVAFGLSTFIAKWNFRKIISGLIGVLTILAMMFGTFNQVGYWKDSVSLFSRALEVTEDNYIMHFNLARKFSSQEDLERAEEHYRQAIRIVPVMTEALNNLGLVLSDQSKTDEAIDCFQRIINIQGQDTGPAIYNHLGLAFQLQGEDEQAMENYNRAIQLDPDFPGAHFNLADLLKSQGKLDQALAHFHRGIQLSPKEAQAYNKIGLILSMQNKFQEAMVYYSKAIELKPDFAGAHNNLAKIYAMLGDIEKAASSFSETLKYRPNWVAAMNDLAWLLAVYKDSELYDPHKALQLAHRACEQTKYKEPEALDTLAVAYAAAGNFEKAIETGQKAIELALSEDNDDLAGRIQKRLELFKQEKPYLEP